MSVIDPLDFLSRADAEALAPPTPPPIGEMTPKKFAKAVLEAFGQIGGVNWLIEQAAIDPRAFISLLQRVLPKTIDLDGDTQGFVLELIDKYTGDPQGRPSPTGKGRIATSDNPADPIQLSVAGVDFEINDTL
jgi:hypothetical protein